ncbi:HAT1 [Candida theae]|uniref:Histone acetyltransferase type B catalytic subunit n=1 Tax=Candida theae TaxID=1198502 RepID=A0AAD5G0N4_9ASCO|nr:HAT1 [Candida theae]KAI5967396.1 HAT1 [Candida theae]
MSLENSKQISAASLQPEVWTSSSNDALKLFITDGEQAINFQPLFTYPIFGDAETIYGYKDLNIFLCFDHYTFKPFLNIKYKEKLDDPELVDLKATMDKYVPECTVFKDEIAWVDSINEEKKSYQIPGARIDSFKKDDIEYQIYKIDLKSAAGLELHKRLQILVLLYIEAGSFIDAEDDLWDLYVLYEKAPEDKEPSIVGFTTAYNYWKYPGAKNFDNEKLEVRIKTSQFIILPTYQGQGLGQLFYSHLCKYWLANKDIVEIVVEDPNEGFDDMRDRADLKRLGELGFDFDKVVAKDIDQEWIKNARAQLKLEKRQFARLLELILLYKLKHNKDVSKSEVRLFIKRRLYKKNKEGLDALDEATRRDKLQTAYQALEEDYYRILGDLRLPVKRKFDGKDSFESKKKKAD